MLLNLRITILSVSVKKSNSDGIMELISQSNDHEGTKNQGKLSASDLHCIKFSGVSLAEGKKEMMNMDLKNHSQVNQYQHNIKAISTYLFSFFNQHN